MDMLRLPKPVIRFMADAMLGRLARWLRILGYDTAYEKVITDDVLIERVLRENLWLLTRDGYLAQRKVLRGRHSLIVSGDLEEQLRQLHQDLKIDLDVNHQRGYRCADCNIALMSISHDEAAPPGPSLCRTAVSRVSPMPSVSPRLLARDPLAGPPWSSHGHQRTQHGRPDMSDDKATRRIMRRADGVLGPRMGTDLLPLRDIPKIPAGIASVGLHQ